MNARCELGWDASALFGALDGDLRERGEALAHAADCSSCRAIASMRARAKEAWAAAMRRDDVEERLASEARLERPWPSPRRAPVKTIGFAIAFAVVACAIGFRLGSKAMPAPIATTPAPTAITTTAIIPVTTPSALPSAPSAPHLVAMSPCTGCRADTRAIEPGMRVGDAVVVPAGAHLTIGFAFGDFVDPTSGADVEGPATARATDGGATFALDRGTARIRGGASTVDVPSARLVATKGATYTLMVDERGGAHVALEAGHVVITIKGAANLVTLDAGGVFDIPPTTRAEALPPPSSAPAPSATSVREAPVSDQESLTAARARFKGGDAAGAKDSLSKLTSSSDATVARRATFTLAEIELASGQRDAARTRLETLITAPEEGLAADSATLLARSFTGPDERASAWQRYLATKPRSPFRERAMLERCDALLDAHHPFEANGLLAELRHATLTPSQTSQLDRLTFKAREVR